MAIDIKQLNPKQFVAGIKKAKEQIQSIKQEKSQKLHIATEKYASKISLVKQEKSIIENKYLVGNPFGVMVYVDHIEFKNQSMPFSGHIDIQYEMRKEQFSKALKNGQIRYCTRNVKHVVFSNNDSQIDLPVDAKVTDIKQAVKFIYSVIANYPESKNKLDKEMLAVNEKLAKLTSEKDNMLSIIAKKYDEQIKRRQLLIESMKNTATPEQLKELDKPKRITKLCAVILGVIIFMAVIANAINTYIEENRNYAINASSEYVFDCNAIWDETSKSIKCSEREINGDYSTYDSVELRSGDANYGLKVEGDKFFKKLPLITIASSSYETNDYSNGSIQSTYGKSNVQLELYNTLLKRNVLTKDIVIQWRFSEADFKLISDKNAEWKRQEAEQKARVAAEQKAEEERAAAEQKAAEEVKRRAEQQIQQTQSTPSTSGSSNSSSGSSNNYSPSTGTNTTVSGYCNDGTYVTGNPAAKGKANDCYGHGGWRDY